MLALCVLHYLKLSSLLFSSHNLLTLNTVKPGSQYDAGPASVMNVVSVKVKSIFFTSQIASLTLNFSTV